MQRVSILNPDLTLTLSQRPVPEPGPGEVLVRVKSVGVCGSDIHYFEHGRLADFVVEGPLVLGHEASGVVEGLGDGVQDLAQGTTVAMEPGVPCGACHECRSGRYNLCPDVEFFATPPIDGAFCEYVVLPRSFVHPVPAHVSFDAAALVEPLSVGVWACQKANVSLGTRVVITGCGPIGAICALVARARGADVVAVTDINAQRRQKVEDLGFTTCDPATAAMPEADVLLECSGSATAID